MERRVEGVGHYRGKLVFWYTSRNWKSACRRPGLHHHDELSRIQFLGGSAAGPGLSRETGAAMRKLNIEESHRESHYCLPLPRARRDILSGQARTDERSSCSLRCELIVVGRHIGHTILEPHGLIEDIEFEAPCR